MTFTIESEERVFEVRRLADVEEWVLYELVDGEGAAGVVGMRVHTELGEVEYEVWKASEKEPRSIGIMPVLEDSLSDTAESMLARIVSTEAV